MVFKIFNFCRKVRFFSKFKPFSFSQIACLSFRFSVAFDFDFDFFFYTVLPLILIC